MVMNPRPNHPHCSVHSSTSLKLAMAATNSLLSLTFLVLSFSLSQAQTGGFRVDLIHRDSPKSPFYNPSETPFDRVVHALKRSTNRATLLNKAAVSLAAAAGGSPLITANHGEYLLNVSIGTPPFEILAIVDTGSDLTWTQCKPCTKCYKQKQPLFAPAKSSTYGTVECASKACSDVAGRCIIGQIWCQYRVIYGDRSITIGALSTDTVNLGTSSGSQISLPRTVFGCGFYNLGTFDEGGSGIIGLGGGTSSIITQMDSLIGGKFSYCLVPLFSAKKTSTMRFGKDGVVSGPGTVSTPLVSKSPSPSTFYFLTLEGISVGGKRLNVPSTQQQVEEGNIIIDSGTTLTLLPTELYTAVEQAVKGAIQAEPINDPQGTLSLCYKVTGEFAAPDITAHFTGADVVLKPVNTFVQISENVVCFAFTASDEISILGNLSQMDFLVGYDLKGKTVSFKPTDCTIA